RSHGTQKRARCPAVALPRALESAPQRQTRLHPRPLCRRKTPVRQSAPPCAPATISVELPRPRHERKLTTAPRDSLSGVSARARTTDRIPRGGPPSGPRCVVLKVTVQSSLAARFPLGFLALTGCGKPGEERTLRRVNSRNRRGAAP